MSERMTSWQDEVTFVANFREVDLGKALGVPRFGVAAVVALAREGYRVGVLVDSGDAAALQQLITSWSGPSAIQIMTEADVKGLEERKVGVELFTHHFQRAGTSLPGILTLYDYHPFTVPWKYSSPRQVQDQMRQGVRHAAAVVTPFPYTYFSIREHLGFGAEKCFLLPGPLMLDADRYAGDSPPPASAERHSVTLLYPAQLQEHKNHAVLFSAVKLLQRRAETRLTLTGSHYRDDVTQNLKRLVDEHGLSHDVVLSGVVSDAELVALYRSSSVTVCPSLAEGGAYVALEALAAGGRVVVADIPAARAHLTSVGADRDVTWFNPMDPADLALAVLTALHAQRTEKRPDLPSWSQYAEAMGRVAGYVLGRGERPFVHLDSSGRYLGLFPASEGP